MGHIILKLNFSKSHKKYIFEEKIAPPEAFLSSFIITSGIFLKSQPLCPI
jgi:hypothetical protein